MTVYATENIRNIAVIGHSDTGKTSLVSALLFDSGAVNRLCKVDDANTTTDFDEDEHDRKITINTAVAHIENRGVKVNLIDTPGYGIFSTDALQGLRVADAALMMVSAVAGVEVQTEKMWKSAADFGLPVLFAVNLMDRDRASYSRVVGALQKKYGREVTPLQLPIGEEANFSGVVDLVSGKSSDLGDEFLFELTNPPKNDLSHPEVHLQTVEDFEAVEEAHLVGDDHILNSLRTVRSEHAQRLIRHIRMSGGPDPDGFVLALKKAHTFPIFYNRDIEKMNYIPFI